jgi:predicted TPR repeat methyltransferase
VRIQLPAIADLQSLIAAWRAEYPTLHALLSNNTEPPRALRLLGLQQWGEGRLEAAVRLLAAAAVLEPDSAPLWGDLAGAYYAISRLDEARACALASLDLDNLRPSSWLLLGTIDSQMQDDSGAERAFIRALDLDPKLAAAFVGLGFIYFRRQRFKEAADRLEAAVRLGNRVHLVHACLAQTLYFLGEFSKAAEVFAIEAGMQPDNSDIKRKLAFCRFIEAMRHDGLQAALAVYDKIAGPHAEERMAMTRKAFHVLSSYGHCDAAIKLGRERLSWAPDDPAQSYLLDALAGKPLVRAPENYIVEYFNLFAETFERQLVDVLGYRTPEDLVDILIRTQRSFQNAADLGCGTGLAGPLLRSLSEALIGIDLSPKMLEKAKEKCVFDDLIEGEIEHFLDHQRDCFDLLFAADVLIYFGDLTQLMRSAARSLRSGGLFAFSIEHGRGNDYFVLPTGRFAHDPSYVEDLANDDYIILSKTPKTIRLEACQPVDGLLYVLQRR